MGDLVRKGMETVQCKGLPSGLAPNPPEVAQEGVRSGGEMGRS